MKKATPIEMRKQLEMVDAMKRAGIKFVPMPALDGTDREELINEMFSRLDKLEIIVQKGGE